MPAQIARNSIVKKKKKIVDKKLSVWLVEVLELFEKWPVIGVVVDQGLLFVGGRSTSRNDSKGDL